MLPGDTPLRTHDHVDICLDNSRVLRFNDPRRFGAMDLMATDTAEAHPLLAKLGPEPLGNQFDEPYLVAALAGKNTPVKSALLDQRIVAGLGNIYVCEALFRAGISPLRRAGRVSAMRVAALVPITWATIERFSAEEPYRLKLSYVRVRLQRTRDRLLDGTPHEPGRDYLGLDELLADLVAEEGLSRADALQLIEGFREALRSRGAIELDEDVYGDAAALSGVSKFSARVKCAMLAWVALEDAIAKA